MILSPAGTVINLILKTRKQRDGDTLNTVYKAVHYHIGESEFEHVCCSRTGPFLQF